MHRRQQRCAGTSARRILWSCRAPTAPSMSSQLALYFPRYPRPSVFQSRALCPISLLVTWHQHDLGILSSPRTCNIQTRGCAYRDEQSRSIRRPKCDPSIRARLPEGQQASCPGWAHLAQYPHPSLRSSTRFAQGH